MVVSTGWDTKNINKQGVSIQINFKNKERNHFFRSKKLRREINYLVSNNVNSTETREHHQGRKHSLMTESFITSDPIVSYVFQSKKGLAMNQLLLRADM